MCKRAASPGDEEEGKASTAALAGAADAASREEMPWSLTFDQVHPTIRAANKEKLSSDLHQLLQIGLSDTCHVQSNVLQEAWGDETARAAAAHQEYKARLAADGAGSPKGKKQKKPADPSVFRAMWPYIRNKWLAAVSLRCLECGLVFAAPIILQAVTRIIIDTQQCATDQGQAVTSVDDRGLNVSLFEPSGDLPDECFQVLWPGYALAVSLFISKLIESVITSQQMMLMTRVALRMRSSLIGNIYRKCLRLSGLGNTSSGQVQNLMATDAQMFLQLAPMINTVFIVPVQLVVTLVWLAFLVGPAFLAGLAIMIAAVPVQGRMVMALFKARAQQQRIADERVKLLNELMQGVRVVKLYAWEESLRAKVEASRKMELSFIRKQRFISCFLAVLLQSLSSFVTVVTFSVYALMGNSLRAGTVVTAHLLLSMLRFPLAFGPILVVQLLNFQVSMKRISRFLTNKELEAHLVDRSAHHPSDACELVKSEPPAAASISGSFYWEAPDVPAKGKGKGKGKGSGTSSGRGRGRGDIGIMKKRSLFRPRGGRGVPTIEAPKPVQAAEPASELSDATAQNEMGKVQEVPAAVPKQAEKTGKDNPTLLDMNIAFPPGKLTMIAGAVGCGKSSILSALLGEMRPAGGSAEVKLGGRVAFVAQSPFILNDTLRENILFGKQMDEDRYQETLSACALLPDLEILPGADMTQIGERGINLSGGQKARITLARAVYSTAPIMLLDDPLSAVDAHVGKHLFKQVLSKTGIAATKTRILVSHQTQYLPLADNVVLVDGGRVVAVGSFRELIDNGAAEAYLGTLTIAEEGMEDEDDEQTLVGAETTVKAVVKQTEFQHGNEKRGNIGSQIVKEEERATGAVSSRVYMNYVIAMGGFGYVLLAFMIASVERVLMLLTDYWLPVWIEADAPSSRDSLIKISRPHRELEFWIPLYFAIAISAATAALCRLLLVQVVMGVRACTRIFAKLLVSVLNATMLFFETTPTGRILNRFTSDTEQLDSVLLMTLVQWLNCILQILSTLTIVSVSNPWFLGWLLPLSILYYLLQSHVKSANRDLKRLETVSRSPIFTHFSETLNGISTIRAYGAVKRFEMISEKFVDANTRCYISQFYAQMWMSMRLDVLGSTVVLAAVILPLVSTNLNQPISPALAGIAISYSIELCQNLKHLSKVSLDLEQSFASVERIQEYTRTSPQETKEGKPAPEGLWPTSGRIVVNKLCVRYRPELPLVLHDVTATIEGKSKIGIVGRTGSGKSTFVSVLWRLVQLSGGEDGAGKGAVSIDGCDINSLKLSDLRSRLAIIPQDPVLFNDTVKYNLDPFGSVSDEELWRVIDLCQMKEAILALPDGIEHKVSENGANFSVGQRQLLCMARAALRHSAVLVLDEATASIDNDTDALLQQAIRKAFSECTVLTIAHRLHTIMDSTQIMLFESGKLVEYDEPHALLSNSSSSFSELVKNTGAAAEHLRSMATEASLKRNSLWSDATGHH